MWAERQYNPEDSWDFDKSISTRPFPNLGKGYLEREGDFMGEKKTKPNVLVDIRTVSVNKSLSREARIVEFIRQIKNPYRFKCGKFTVTAKYADTGLTLEDCLLQMVN